MVTTIKIHDETKLGLNKYREYKNESYDEIIKKLIFIIKKFHKQPELSQEALESIEKARARLKAGKFLSEEEAKRRMGF
jgi:hypothetical protein